MQKWNDFQSLLQFAAGSNLALFTLSRFPEQFIANERALLESMKEKIDCLPANASERGTYIKLKSRFSTLQDTDQSAIKTMGIVSSILFFVSMIALLIASYRADDPIELFWQLVSMVVNIPIILSLIYYILQMRAYTEITAGRRVLDDALD